MVLALAIPLAAREALVLSKLEDGFGEVSPSGHQVLKQSGCLFPIIGLLPSERSKNLGSSQNTPSGNDIFPVLGGGGDYVSSPSYSYS